MTRTFDIAVIGATGSVGEALVQLLEEREFPVATLYPLASSRSAGDTVRFGGKNIEIKDVEEFDWSQVQIALFSAGATHEHGAHTLAVIHRNGGRTL